jgi:DNA replication and repair protein RecF
MRRAATRNSSSCRCASRAYGLLRDQCTISAALSDLALSGFRCFGTAELQFSPRLNVITGENGGGKTSLLEAVYLLGRGRSFRAADSRVLIQKGSVAADVTGWLGGRDSGNRLRVHVRAGGTDVTIGPQSGSSVAELVGLFPVQAIPTNVGEIIQGPPDARRRMLDWGVFHVEHSYLRNWREFRRALAQRNAALRAGDSDDVLDAWEQELAAAAAGVDDMRKGYLERLRPVFEDLARRMLQAECRIGYSPGWSTADGLLNMLRGSREEDRQAGYTRTGPHRADVRIEMGDDPSRWRTSRGQQKLLGAALVMSICQVAAAEEGRVVSLMVDEPAADLDSRHLERFLACLYEMPAQLFVAAITVHGLSLPADRAMFHVEHGQAKPLL